MATNQAAISYQKVAGVSPDVLEDYIKRLNKNQVKETVTLEFAFALLDYMGGWTITTKGKWERVNDPRGYELPWRGPDTPANRKIIYDNLIDDNLKDKLVSTSDVGKIKYTFTDQWMGKADPGEILANIWACNLVWDVKGPYGGNYVYGVRVPAFVRGKVPLVSYPKLKTPQIDKQTISIGFFLEIYKQVRVRLDTQGSNLYGSCQVCGSLTKLGANGKIPPHEDKHATGQRTEQGWKSSCVGSGALPLELDNSRLKWRIQTLEKDTIDELPYTYFDGRDRETGELFRRRVFADNIAMLKAVLGKWHKTTLTSVYDDRPRWYPGFRADRWVRD